MHPCVVDCAATGDAHRRRRVCRGRRSTVIFMVCREKETSIVAIVYLELLLPLDLIFWLVLDEQGRTRDVVRDALSSLVRMHGRSVNHRNFCPASFELDCGGRSRGCGLGEEDVRLKVVCHAASVACTASVASERRRRRGVAFECQAVLVQSATSGTD